MGFFSFDGLNLIFEDLISQFPDGSVYFKDKNIIPWIESITFIENMGPISEVPAGTAVQIYIDGRLHETKYTTNEGGNSFIYSIMKTPYNKFKIKTAINGQIYNEQTFYAINILAFFVIIAKTYNYDYQEMFRLFGNLFFNTIQSDTLYPMWGWCFDFNKGNLNDVDYRRALIGTLPLPQNPLPIPSLPIIGYLGTIRSFMHSITYFGLKELIRSFTTEYPIIFSYRNYDGWIVKDNSLVQFWNFPKYWLIDNYMLVGTNNISSIDVSGQTFTIGVNGYKKQITFPANTNTPALILATLQNKWCGFVNIQDNGGGDLRIKFKANVIEIFDDVANSSFGFTVGFYTHDPETAFVRGSVNLNTAIPGIKNTTLELNIDGIDNTMTFSSSISTITDIENELKAVFGNYVSVTIYGGIPRANINGFSINIVGGTALPYLGWTVGVYGLNTNNKRVILLNKKFKLNAIRILIRNWVFGDTKKAILEKLVEWICPTGTKIEVSYKDNIWNPLYPL